MKEVWKILNSTISNKPKSNIDHKYFQDNNKDEHNMKKVYSHI